MARPDKAAKVAELKEEFSTSAAAVLTEYRGLTVKDLRNLRRSLGEDATYAVAKNTLAAIAAKEAGKSTFGAAKNPDQIDAVIRNTFIQGTLSIIFAALVVVVFVTGVVVALRAIRGTARPLTEDEPVPSRIFAPSGLIPTDAEKEVQRQWDALPSSHAKSVGIGKH